MNPFVGLGLVVGGIILFNRIGTAGTAASLKYVFLDINAKFKDAFNIQVNIDIGIQNPTSNSFTIQSFAGDLYINGYYIGNVSNFTATQVVANAQTSYRVAVLVSTYSVPSAVLNLLQNLTNFSAKLDASINVDNLSVPVKLEKKVF